MMLVEFDHVLERKIASDIRIEDEKWFRIYGSRINETATENPETTYQSI
jgi:hypothetical protein